MKRSDEIDEAVLSVESLRDRQKLDALACGATERCTNPISFKAQMLDQGNKVKRVGTCPCYEYNPSIELVNEDGSPIQLR